MDNFPINPADGVVFAVLLLSALLMLQHLGENDAATRIRRALDRVLASGQVRTRDLGGTATTSEFTTAVSAAIDAGA